MKFILNLKRNVKKTGSFLFHRQLSECQRGTQIRNNNNDNPSREAPLRNSVFYLFIVIIPVVIQGIPLGVISVPLHIVPIYPWTFLNFSKQNEKISFVDINYHSNKSVTLTTLKCKSI